MSYLIKKFKNIIIFWFLVDHQILDHELIAGFWILEGFIVFLINKFLLIPTGLYTGRRI